MGSNWAKGKLEELAIIEMGQSPLGETCNQEGIGIPLLNGPTEFGNYHPTPVQFTTDARKFSVPNDILFCVRGSTTGRMNWADQKYAIGRGVAAMRHRSGSEYRYFLKALIDLHLDKLLASATGSTFPNVSREQLTNLDCEIPPLPEQRAIAGILGALDDKIELNHRMNTTLESITRAVFRQWFVESEEVANCEVGRLGDVIKVNERSISKEYPHSEIEYIEISSVTTGHLENITQCSLADAPSRARRLVKHGDTIWSTVRPNRKSYLFVSEPKDNLIVSTGFAVLTPEKIPPSYLYCWVTTDSFVDYLVSNADGSAYPAVGAERFANAEVLLPPKDVLDKFENVVGTMLARIAHNEKESRTLGSLRDSLLPKLMRGEVRVKDVEKEL